MLLALLVTVWVGYFIVKRYKPQTILFIGGMFLMLVSVLFGWGEIFPGGKGSTGSLIFDLFEVIRSILSSRAGKLGLNIMAVAGFARYMDHIGASRALVNLTIQPLLRLKSPYFVMSACWALGMLLGLAINSASGLAMLLMVTMFPILVALGVSRLSAAAAIATTLCLDWSPSDTGTILAAELSGIDPVIYWHSYQVPIALCVFPVVALLHYFTQKYMDKRSGHQVVPMTSDQVEVNTEGRTISTEKPPALYALLPLVPLALILIFSPLLIENIEMDIIKAMLIGTAVGMVAQYIRTRNGKLVANDLQVFFDGLGMQMANVVTLIVAGETFARGLTVSGTIDGLISGTNSSGFGAVALSLVMITIIGVCAIVMGSGNAPFFAFANLVPEIAAKSGIPAVTMILPMHFIASSARAISPITAVIIVVSGMANISSFELVKRTAIPMIGSCLTVVIMNFILF